MKPVFQTIFSNVNGNCYQAAIASLLELELDSVPHFVELYGDNYHQELQLWLSNFNLMCLRIPYREIEKGNIVAPFLPLPENSHCLAIGKSKNYPDTQHAVVGMIVQGVVFYLMHDPNPNGKGLLGDPDCLEFFVQKNPKI